MRLEGYTAKTITGRFVPCVEIIHSDSEKRVIFYCQFEFDSKEDSELLLDLIIDIMKNGNQIVKDGKPIN